VARKSTTKARFGRKRKERRRRRRRRRRRSFERGKDERESTKAKKVVVYVSLSFCGKVEE
tara:strand:+ start:398 stop:577 length:180 start_codon:yes stop_codon:yes gene_type:complete